MLKQLANKPVKIIKADQSTYEVIADGETDLEDGTEIEVQQGFIVRSVDFPPSVSTRRDETGD